jgi:hypothetical protein
VSLNRSAPHQPLAVALLAAVSGGTLALGMPASGSAAVTIGQTGLPDTNCSTTDNIMQTATGGPPFYTVPAGGGVITLWSFQTSEPGLSGKMLVMGPTGGGNEFIVVGKTDLQTFMVGPAQTFGTRIPVQGGETIGIRMAMVGSCLDDATVPGDEVRYSTTTADPPDGSIQALDNLLNQYRVLVAASVEPDCDQDGFGDETQDANLFGGSCPPKARNLTLEISKPKVKRGKKIKFYGRLDTPDGEQACESNQTVELQRKRAYQDDFVGFEQLQTDASGSFSLKRKVTKTYEYRAQVAGAGGCDFALSDIERVKVKKKK